MFPTNSDKKEIRHTLDRIYDCAQDISNMGEDSFSTQLADRIIDLHSDLEDHLKQLGII